MPEETQQNTVQNEQQVTYESALQDKDFVDSMYYSLIDLGEKDLPYEPKTILDKFLTKKRYLETNILSAGRDALLVEDLPEDSLKFLGYALKKVDELPNFYEKGGAPTGAALADYALAGLTDPTNLLSAVAGAFTLGTGGAAALAAREAGRQGVIQLIKAKLAAAVSKPVVKSLAVEGAVSGVGGASQEALIQDIEKNTGIRKKDDYSAMLLQGVLEGTLSPLFGVTANILGSAALKTGKDALENIPAVESAGNWLQKNFMPTAGIGEIPRRMTERRIGEISSIQDKAAEIQKIFETAAIKELGDITSDASVSFLNKGLERDAATIQKMEQVAPQTLNAINQFHALKLEAQQYGINSLLNERTKGIFGLEDDANYVRSVADKYYKTKRQSFDKFIAKNPTILEDYKQAVIQNAALPAENQNKSFAEISAKFIEPSSGNITLPDSKVNEIIKQSVRELYEPSRAKKLETGAFKAKEEELPDIVKKIIGYNNTPALRITETISGIVNTGARTNLAGDVAYDAIRRNIGVETESEAVARAALDGRDVVRLVTSFDKGTKDLEKSLSPFKLPSQYVDPRLKNIWVDKEYALQLKELFDDTPFLNAQQYDSLLGSAFRTVLGVQAFAKAGKTIYSPLGQVRNAIGATLYAAISGNTRGLFDTVKAVKKMSNPEIKAAWKDFEDLGLKGSNLDLNQALKRFADVVGASDETSFLEKFLYLGKPGKFAREAYSYTDDLAKFVVFQNEKRKAQKILNAFSPEMRERMLRQFGEEYNIPVEGRTLDALINERAAVNTANITPIYGRIPPILEKLRTVPLVGSFVAYPAERLRNTYNILKLATDELREGFETGNKELTKAGVSRIAQWYMGQGALYTAAFAVNEAAGNSQTMEVLRRSGLLPEYKKDNALIITKFDKNGNPYLVDFSYVNPDQGVTGAVIPMMLKAMRGEDVSTDLDKSIFSAGKKLIEPFISPTLVVDAASNMLEVAKGDLNKLGPLVKTLEPGFMSMARSMVTDAGLLDDKNSVLYNVDKFFDPRKFREIKERPADIIDYLAKNGLVFPGMKEEKLDLKKATGFALMQLSRSSKTNWNTFRRDLDAKLADPAAIYDAATTLKDYDEALTEQFAYQQGLRNLYLDLSDLLGKDKAKKTIMSDDLRAVRPSQKEMGAVFFGKMRPLTLSSETDFWVSLNKSLIENTGESYMPEFNQLRQLMREVEQYYKGRNLEALPPELNIE